MRQGPSTRDHLLDTAERFCQTRGYNGFSFRDLADAVGIRTASIHYHFPTKADLGRALILRYRQRMEAALAEVERRDSAAPARLRRFAGILRDLLRDGNRLCLCGILAAEANTLTDDMRADLRAAIEQIEKWLTQVLDDGRKAGQVGFEGASAATARAVLATLEGAMLSARAVGDDRRLSEASDWLIASLSGQA
jgi:TetR/AcrR family transcriptional repressor of nem operon